MSDRPSQTTSLTKLIAAAVDELVLGAHARVLLGGELESEVAPAFERASEVLWLADVGESHAPFAFALVGTDGEDLEALAQAVALRLAKAGKVFVLFRASADLHGDLEARVKKAFEAEGLSLAHVAFDGTGAMLGFIRG